MSVLFGWQQPAHAADFPSIPSGSLYSGQASKERSVELYLLNNNYFILRQISLDNSKANRDLTGLWQQSANKTLLKLSNRYGFQITINVGASGNLYGDFFHTRTGLPVSTTLKRTPFKKPEFTFMGLVQARDPRHITDAATGKIFDIKNPQSVAHLIKEKAIFMDVLASPSWDGLTIVRVRSHSEYIPDGYQQDSRSGKKDQVRVNVQTIACSRIWQLPESPNWPRSSCFFSDGKKEGQGFFELSALGLRVELPYSYTSTGAFRFSIDAKTRKSLQLLKLTALLKALETTNAWELRGTHLVLKAQQNVVLVLE